MMDLGSPFTKREIVDALVREETAVSTFFSSIPDDAFFDAPADVWTPAENLVHLIKSVSPVAMALNLPKLVIRLLFGKASAASRTIAEVRTAYVDGALADGGAAGGPYLPQVNETTSAEKARILAKWAEKSDELARAVKNWLEADLDKLRLPHPLLGKISVREMLLFTLYHNMHHVNDVARLLTQPEHEWFG